MQRLLLFHSIFARQHTDTFLSKETICYILWETISCAGLYYKSCQPFLLTSFPPRLIQSQDCRRLSHSYYLPRIRYTKASRVSYNLSKAAYSYILEQKKADVMNCRKSLNFSVQVFIINPVSPFSLFAFLFV